MSSYGHYLLLSSDVDSAEGYVYQNLQNANEMNTRVGDGSAKGESSATL